MSAALDRMFFNDEAIAAPRPSSRSQLTSRPSVEDALGIGDMARLFGTTLRTLRFYESRGLLKPRREGQNRYYDAAQQTRFRLIDEGRKLGFTLSEIAGMLAQSRNSHELQLTLEEILSQIEHLENQRREIEQAIGSLRRRYYVMGEPASERHES